MISDQTAQSADTANDDDLVAPAPNASHAQDESVADVAGTARIATNFGANADRVNPQDDTSVKSTTAMSAPADFAVMVHGADEDLERLDGAAALSPSNNDAGGEKATADAKNLRESVETAPTEVDAPNQPASSSSPPHHRRKRPRTRTARTVAVLDDGPQCTAEPNDPRRQSLTLGLALPQNQYECTLYRRAVRKRRELSEADPVVKSANAASANQDSADEGESEGDVSLGMKLTVVGGKVIVQQLNALEDGRASPAQLAGVIERGDILLSINDVSLLNLPIDQLMRGLSPLSTPDSSGVFQRVLKLRLASKEGLPLLERSLAGPARAGQSTANQTDVDGAADMFRFFPMVDQLSGMPLFENEPRYASDRYRQDDTERGPTEPNEEVRSTKAEPRYLSLDELISSDVAWSRQRDKARFISEYFAWRDGSFSDILCGSVSVGNENDGAVEGQNDNSSISPPLASLTLNQFIERGRRAVIGARALSDKLEAVDRGRDSRSLKSWKTTISLYSRASARRRAMQAFDTASVPINFGRLEEEEDDDENEENFDEMSSVGSHSDEGELLDADAQLLRLAANDTVWRKQVLAYIEKVTEEREKGESLPEYAEVDGAVSEPDSNIDAALSTELGSFLFGDKMSKIITKQKKSLALPPDEITALLFDLATKLNATIPEEVATGSQRSRQSSITPFMGNGKATTTQNQDIQMASSFLLDDVLPVWFNSFNPLPWEQRRILWPLDRPTFGGSTTASSTFSDDSFTQESVGVASQLFMGGSPKMAKRSKNLRERIEDMELNAESRAETCYLTTHYFTQKLLPKPMKSPDASIEALDACIAFVRKFGSYLKLHTCLVHAAAARADDVVSVLLELARYDPRHKELMKLGVKPNMLVFYEQSMLSSILERLHSLKHSFVPDMWLATIDLCAASYPDVQPWQVQAVCGEHENEKRKMEMEDLYYIYLSQLLHPMDGHDAARRNRDLVQEWCALSVLDKDHGTFKDRTPDRRRNFFCVASRTSSAHLLYSRDLVSLLRLSHELGESDLELDIVGELLEHGDDIHADVTNQRDAARTALDHLRTLVNGALEWFEDRESSVPSVRKLKRTLRIYQTASRSCLDELYVPRELLRWIRHLSKVGGRRRTLALVRFLADEANPTHVLEATHAWTASARGGNSRTNALDSFEIELLPVLQTVLIRAAQPSISSGVYDEFSGVLSKLRRTRQRLQQREEEGVTPTEGSDRSELVPSPNIWARMETGTLPVLK